MSSLILAGLVTAGAVALFAALAVVVRRRLDAERAAAAAQLPEVDLDPFHALAVASGWPGGAMTDPVPADAAAMDLAERKAAAFAALDRAAVGALLQDGLITIDRAGLLTVAAPGVEPATVHPVAAAWLECLHRAERPATMSELRDDPELRRVHEAFLQERDAPLARWSREDLDDVGCAAFLLTLLLGVFYAALLGFSVGDEVIVHVILTAVLGPLFVGVLAALLVPFFPDRPNLLREHCAGLPPHPALAALDADQEQLIGESER